MIFHCLLLLSHIRQLQNSLDSIASVQLRYKMAQLSFTSLPLEVQSWCFDSTSFHSSSNRGSLQKICWSGVIFIPNPFPLGSPWLGRQGALGWEGKGTFLQKDPPLSGSSSFLEFMENKTNHQRDFLHGEWDEEGEQLTISPNEPQCNKTLQKLNLLIQDRDKLPHSSGLLS